MPFGILRKHLPTMTSSNGQLSHFPSSWNRRKIMDGSKGACDRLPEILGHTPPKRETLEEAEDRKGTASRVSSLGRTAQLATSVRIRENIGKRPRVKVAHYGREISFLVEKAIRREKHQHWLAEEIAFALEVSFQPTPLGVWIT